jgi:hypothetical protein
MAQFLPLWSHLLFPRKGKENGNDRSRVASPPFFLFMWQSRQSVLAMLKTFFVNFVNLPTEVSAQILEKVQVCDLLLP